MVRRLDYRRNGPAVYVQIADGLRRQIDSGELQPGDVLPKTADLMRDYNAARDTVRKAYELLRRDGLVTTLHGHGVFVRAKQALETVQVHRGDCICGRMPTPEERASLALDDGVCLLVVQRKSGGVEVYPADRTRLVSA